MPTPPKGVTNYKQTEEFVPEERDVLIHQNRTGAYAELIASGIAAVVASIKKKEQIIDINIFDIKSHWKD